jgi:trigger factor
LNVQTERIDNHKAQFTVEIEAKQLDDAKRKAAKKIAGQIRIKGFRKGKAPYRVVSQYVGEAAILEEAIELLGNDIYKDALDESGVEPYGPGMLDDFKVDPAPTFVFSVPLQPEVDLKGYADIRLDFEEPEVADEDVENALKSMQRQQATVVNAELEEVAAGHRVTVDLHSEFVDGEDDEEPSEDADDSEEDAGEYIPKKGDQFLHQHDATLVLEPSDEPIMPGFVDGLVGGKLNEDVEFELTVPEGNEDYDTIVGRTVKFHVTIKKIEEIEVPALDDAFALQIGEADEDDTVVDLASLRARTHDELEKEALENAKSIYAEKVLTEIIDGADIAFPEMMIEEQIDDMLRDLDNNLQQQGMNLETYMRFSGMTKEMLQEQYRDQAIASLNRTLVFRELINVQEIEIGDEQINKRVDAMLMQFGDSAEQFRQYFDTPQMRQNILNELLMDNIMTRIVALGQDKDAQELLAEREAEQDAETEKARQRVERMLASQSEEDENEEEDEASTEDAPADVEAQDEDAQASADED